MEQIADFFRTLSENAQVREAGRLVGYMAVGGVLGLFIRALYRRFGLSVSNRDAFSSNFALLTSATVLIIFVVKSSLALSLGLVGALSIVRFRAAIKEPEELVFLFFCIAIGLALGAEYSELAVGGTAVFTGFVLLRHRFAEKGGKPSLLLTITGSEQDLFDGQGDRITGALSEVAGAFTVQRLDADEGQVQFRAVVSPESQAQIGAMIAALRSKLPQCRISYVNLANLL